jgi:hypothetical protein
VTISTRQDIHAALAAVAITVIIVAFTLLVALSTFAHPYVHGAPIPHRSASGKR